MTSPQLHRRASVATNAQQLRVALFLQVVLFLIVAIANGVVDRAYASNKSEQSDRIPIRSFYRDPAIFSDAIERAENITKSFHAISGITVPHHLVAADLIARAFKLIDGQAVDKVIILFPDHFRKARRPFATTKRDFDTVFGLVRTEYSDASRLLKSSRLIEESDLFESDHGIAAILPFLKHVLPDVKIIPIAVAISSTRTDWDQLITILSQRVSSRTLVVQSTDFSHYLKFGDAIRRDQQSLNVLASGDLDEVERLSQPSNLDSRGSQYIQLRLQKEFFHAHPIVMFNSNQQAYSDAPQSQTTSYIVQVYDQDSERRVGADAPGSRVYCFAGDTFFGRSLRQLLIDPLTASRVFGGVDEVLNGCRLVLNLEGVVVPQVPLNIPPNRLIMLESLTSEWLRKLHVVAVSIANNHAGDLGEEALETMTRDLRSAGLKVLRHGEEADLGSFRLIALTDLDNSRQLQSGAIMAEDIQNVARSTARPPLIAFLHWGTEYDPDPGLREKAIAEELRHAVVSLIVGAHPHVSTGHLQLLGHGETLMAFSLGNFLFDQSSTRASGAILEVRVFAQGTYFVRLLPIPNLFDLALRSRIHE